MEEEEGAFIDFVGTAVGTVIIPEEVPAPEQA